MIMESTTTPATAIWRLCECRDDGQSPRIVSLSDLPVTVGRVSDALLCIDSVAISKRHAELRMSPDGPVVHDLGSTNGTHVNGQRVAEAQLIAGDVVQFANTVFRVEHRQLEDHGATMEEGAIPWAQALMQFDTLMNGQGLVPNFQPIIELASERRIGYEMLARSSLEGLQNPGVMFSTAAKLNQECALSEMLRIEGAVAGLAMCDAGKLFFNTHPKEVDQERLVLSLERMRQLAPNLEIVIEIHEAAVTDCESMKTFRAELTRLDMQLAYDDFGAGQARLDELADVPPDYLKFDIKLIRNLDTAVPGRVRLVESLVQVVLNLGVTPLAEGVETPGEAKLCRELGFELAQGYLFGRPAPLALIA